MANLPISEEKCQIYPPGNDHISHQKGKKQIMFEPNLEAQHGPAWATFPKKFQSCWFQQQETNTCHLPHMFQHFTSKKRVCETTKLCHQYVIACNLVSLLYSTQNRPDNLQRYFKLFGCSSNMSLILLFVGLSKNSCLVEVIGGPRTCRCFQRT